MIAKRLEGLRQQLNDHDVDCLALIPGSNLRYLTGLNFHMLNPAFIAFFPADADVEPVLMIPNFDKLKWEIEAPFPSRAFAWNPEEGPGEAMRQAVAALPEIRTLAVEHLRMRVQEHALLREHFPDASITQGEPLMQPLRILKTADEVSAIRQACGIAETALEEVISSISVGMTEREIANRLLAAMRLGGGGTPPFEPIVLTGLRSAQAHGTPGQHPIKDGDLLLIDFGTTVDGYACDITRTFAVGREPDKSVRAMYEVVLEANEVGRTLVKPGETAQGVKRAVRQFVDERGFGESLYDVTGHGFGLDIHEQPFLMEGNDMALEAGMTMTIEPFIFDKELGGIRIEDDVVATEDGSEALTSFDRELRVIGASK